MTLQAVLFDMDGLLVDSEPLWFEVEAGIMARMGSPWGQADQEHLIGGSLRRSTAYMRRKAAVPVPEETIAEWLTQGMAGLVRRRGSCMLPAPRRCWPRSAPPGCRTPWSPRRSRRSWTRRWTPSGSASR